MEEGQVGIFAVLWRFFTFYKWRKARALVRAANKQFTGSVQGIADAFDITHDKFVVEYHGLRDAVSEVEGIAEEKRGRLADLNTEEERLIKLREGAISAAEKAKEAGNQEEYEKHANAFKSFQTRIDEIETEQKTLDEELTAIGKSMKTHMLRLTEMQREMDRLPRQKADEIAKYVGAKKIIELNDRLQNLQTSMQRGPIDEVLKANRELSAKARISEKLAGTDARLQDQEYEREGLAAAAEAKLNDVLAARAAEKAAKRSGATKPREDDRPTITK